MWGQAVERLCEQNNQSVETACKLFGRTRQAYYQGRKDLDERIRREQRIVDCVKEIRHMDSGIGCLKLWQMMQNMFQEDWVPGRDTFYGILRRNGLMLKKPKPRHTTNSNHRFHKYKNLIKGFVPTAPNQLWVSDITYIDLEVGCCYLHLVTDAYSHKIVGWCLADTLEALNTLRALQDAIRQAGLEDLHGLIHHSDRGVQYCSNIYVEELNKYQIQISMTEDYKPTDNAIAERVNGILKTEVIYREKRYKDLESALKRIGEFVDFYNNKRPHYSIGLKTPEQVYHEDGKQKQMWKKKKYQKTLPQITEVVTSQSQQTVPVMG